MRILAWSKKRHRKGLFNRSFHIIMGIILYVSQKSPESISNDFFIYELFLKHQRERNKYIFQ